MGKRSAYHRCEPSGGACSEQRLHDPTPQNQEHNRGGHQHEVLPLLLQRARQRDCSTENRADRRWSGAVEERPGSGVLAQTLKALTAEQDEREGRSEATLAASTPPAMPCAA